MATEQLDRAVLDGKDREQLHAIAGAIGVKAPTRMRKAELIEAILASAPAPTNGASAATEPRSRTVRSARASEVEAESVERLAAEEAAIATAAALPADDFVAPRPQRPGADAAPAAPQMSAPTTETERPARPGNVPDGDDDRAPYGDANQRRRRRRRGRGAGGFEDVRGG